jgi:hypothetical protein
VLLKNADSLASAKVNFVAPMISMSRPFGFAIIDEQLVMVEGALGFISPMFF